MKIHSLLFCAILLSISAVIISGCKYNVAEPPWDSTVLILPDKNPQINSISPPEGIPGANSLTINGENFNLVPDSNIILETPTVFGISPEVVEKTLTSIVIRRPDLVTDSLFVKVWGDSGVVKKFGPYKIDAVYEEFGTFLENFILSGPGIDNAGNLYVFRSDTNRTIFKIAPDGQQSVIGRATRQPSGSALGPDGGVYIFSANRQIEKLNPETNVLSEWHRLKTNRQVSMGSFDSNGFLYTCGARTGLWIVNSNDSTSTETAFYPSATDTIYAVQVIKEGANEFLYVSASSAGVRGIWRHSIDNGNLAPGELILNMRSDSRFSGRIARSISFSINGRLFLGTDSPNPVLVYNNGSLDYFYKDILPPYCKQFISRGNYLYMVIGNSNPAENWKVYRVDAGETLIP